MVKVPAGGFWMGCSPSDDNWCDGADAESCCTSAERPRHYVEIPDFWIDATEVSVRAYRTCVEAGSCSPSRDQPKCAWGRGVEFEDHPINCVTFLEAEAFCAWGGKRLCSEAEWEKASVGGCEFYGSAEPCEAATRRHPWGGTSPTCDLAWFAIYDTDGETSLLGCGTGFSGPVGSKPQGQSPYGVHDLLGNEFEYVADCLHDDYEGAPNDGSAWTEECTSLVPGMARGGDWQTIGRFLRTTLRWDRRPREECCGIRCCSSTPP